MKFTELLTANNLTVDTVSAGLRAKIKRYEKIELALDQARTALAAATTDKKRKDIGSEITRGEENLASLNEEIATGIQRNIDNAESIEKRKKDLEEIRKKKAQKNDEPAGDPPAGDPPASDPPASDPPSGDPPAKDVEEPKKKSSGVGVVLGVLAAVALGFVGIKYMNRE